MRFQRLFLISCLSCNLTSADLQHDDVLPIARMVLSITTQTPKMRVFCCVPLGFGDWGVDLYCADAATSSLTTTEGTGDTLDTAGTASRPSGSVLPRGRLGASPHADAPAGGAGGAQRAREYTSDSGM